VEFVAYQRGGRLYIRRGKEFTVDIPRDVDFIVARTHPGPEGFMKLRPSPDDILALRGRQDYSMIIGPDGRWITYSRSGSPRIVAGG